MEVKNCTITITTQFNEEELAQLRILSTKVIAEKQKAGIDCADATFEDFLQEHIHLYLFEHLEENVKLMLQTNFGITESEIGRYELTGRFD